MYPEIGLLYPFGVQTLAEEVTDEETLLAHLDTTLVSEIARMYVCMRGFFLFFIHISWHCVCMSVSACALFRSRDGT